MPRDAALRVASPENAAWLSPVAYARHTLTDYDALPAQDYDRDSARFFIADELARLLGGWGVKRRLGEGEQGIAAGHPARARARHGTGARCARR